MPWRPARTPESQKIFADKLLTAGKGIMTQRRKTGVIYRCIRLIPVDSYHETDDERATELGAANF